MSIDKKVVCHELKVKKRIVETPDTVSLILDVPRTTGGKFNYRAGQFITLFLDINGEEIRRSYSLASSPDCDTDFIITVKRVPGGKASNFLNEQVQEGDHLWCTPPAGHFCLSPNNDPKNIVFFAAGSGITPIYSILKTVLKTMPKTKVFLLYQNRSEQNIIFQKQLKQLQASHDKRFFRLDYISDGAISTDAQSGRVNESAIQQYVNSQNVVKDTTYFMCGPQGFMGMISESLNKMGVSKENIIQESFHVPPAAEKTHERQKVDSGTHSLSLDTSNAALAEALEIDADAILIGDKNNISKPETIEAIIDGESHLVPYTNNNDTVLDCLLKAKLNPPYSCLDGACMACIAKVNSGLVYQKELGIMTEDNVEASECLTCQAKPASKIVKIHFETF